MPTILLAPAIPPGRALLPADLLVHFAPWRSQLAPLPPAHFDALVWDGIAQYYPWRHFAAESLRAGVVPLWNPYQFCGTPFLANGQSAALYPLNLLFWVLPTALAFVWSAWLHLALTGWFAYLLLRRLDAGRIGSLVGAVVWQANSFTVAWIHLPTVLCTVAWLPLVLLLCERVVVLRPQPALPAAAAGAALGLSYLGGHPQMFLFVALLSAVYLVARGLSRDAGGSIGARFGRLAVSGAIVGIVALGLTAAQLLPTLDFLRLAHRTFTPGPESYAFYLKRALQPVQLIGILLPHAFGHPANGTYTGPENYAEYALYVGLVPLCLALWAAKASRTWQARFFSVVAGAALLVALGTAFNWPLYHWLGLWRSGSPARIIVLFVFSMSLLAGMGVDFLARREWAGGGTRPLALLPVALVVLIAADLLLAARGHIHAVPRELVYPKVADGDTSPGRVLGNAADWPLREFPVAALPPNAATVYHLRDAFGYDSLYFAHYRDFATLIQDGDPSPPANGNMLLPRLTEVHAPALEMMRLAGVTTVLSPVPVTGLGAASAEDGLRAYPVPHPRPRAWVTTQVTYVSDQRAAIAALRALPTGSRSIVLLSPPSARAVPTSAAQSAAQVRDLSPNAVSVGLLWPSAGPPGGAGLSFLFLADAYAPGWHAYAGGNELPVVLADTAFRAVPLPHDARRVEFRYQPAAYRLGLFVALLTLASLAAIVGISAGKAGARSVRETPAAEGDTR